MMLKPIGRLEAGALQQGFWTLGREGLIRERVSQR